MPESRDLSPLARLLNVAGAAMMALIGLGGVAFSVSTLFWWAEYLRGPSPFQPEAGSGWFWAIVGLTAAGFALPPLAFWRVYARLRGR